MGRVAEEFRTSRSYAVGDLTLYGGVLYQFIVSHSGAWNADHVTAYDTSLERDVTRVVSAAYLAEKAVGYAEDYPIVFEPEQIFGTRNKYILTSEGV